MHGPIQRDASILADVGNKGIGGAARSESGMTGGMTELEYFLCYVDRLGGWYIYGSTIGTGDNLFSSSSFNPKTIYSRHKSDHSNIEFPSSKSIKQVHTSKPKWAPSVPVYASPHHLPLHEFTQLTTIRSQAYFNPSVPASAASSTPSAPSSWPLSMAS